MKRVILGYYRAIKGNVGALLALYKGLYRVILGSDSSTASPDLAPVQYKG